MANNDPVKEIKAALTDTLHIDHLKHPIQCDLIGDALLMEGTVETLAQKKKALLIAMGLEGVEGVIDRLKVRQSTTMTDDEVLNHIRDAFDEEPTLKDYNFKVEVTNGIVDLEGQVWSLSHKRLAGVLAWWVPGTMDVINSIEVNPPEEDNDDEVTDALRLVLEKDRLVDASEIKILTKGSVVTLLGVAKSDFEREAAEDDAWYLWGVNEVINNITILPPP